MEASPAELVAAEIPEMRERLETIRQILHVPPLLLPQAHESVDAGDPGAQTLIEELFAGGVKQTRDRLSLLIDQYVDDPAVLEGLMGVFDQVSSLEGLYERSLSALQQQQQQRPASSDGDGDGDDEGQREGIAAPVAVAAAAAAPVAHDADWERAVALSEGLSRSIEALGPLLAPVAPETAAAVASGRAKTPLDSVIDTPPAEAAAAEAAPVHRPEQPREPEPELPDMTCPICYDDVLGKDCFRFKECGHQYCLDCLDDYVLDKIKQGKVLDMKCPDPRCKTVLTYNDVSAIVSDDAAFAKYEEFTFLAALKAEPNLRWCPRPGCGNALIGSEEYPHMVCNKPGCGHHFCFKCGEDWHTGTCEQYKQWKLENSQEETRTAEWAKANTKACPNCKAQIEKNSGCNHMTCGNCHHQFCWLCGGKYTPNHYELYNVLGCPGMQYSTEGEKPPTFKNNALSMAKRIGMRALIGTGVVVGTAVVAALAVPTLLIGAPIYGGYQLHKEAKRRQRQRRRNYRIDEHKSRHVGLTAAALRILPRLHGPHRHAPTSHGHGSGSGQQQSPREASSCSCCCGLAGALGLCWAVAGWCWTAWLRVVLLGAALWLQGACVVLEVAAAVLDWLVACQNKCAAGRQRAAVPVRVVKGKGRSRDRDSTEGTLGDEDDD
eukprot:m51a1_g10350 putative ibr domain containing protein (662) ;mRNA; f:182433-185927